MGGDLAKDRHGLAQRAEFVTNSVHERDRYRARDPNFEYSEIFLQIAIVTAAVAILAESKATFVFSLVSAAARLVLTATVSSLAGPFRLRNIIEASGACHRSVS